MIGKGSYGIIHKVTTDDEEYATKQIDPELRKAVSEIEPKLLTDLREYALHECLLLSELDHPNVVRFLGVSVTDDNVILVMEYLPTSLPFCLEEYENFPPPYKFSVLRDACLGLEYLHTYRPPLIHRDVSANNIMLTADLKAKLVDVGSARQVGTKREDGTMSACPGALVCMPPEALIEGSIYDEKIDIFSIGNVILHVVTQKWPIPVEVIEKVQAEDAPLYADPEVNVRLPYIREMGKDHSLLDVVLRCLQSNPKARPSATDIVEKLEVLCAKYPISKNPLEMFEMIVALQLQAAHSMPQIEIDPAHAQWLVSDLRLNAMKNQVKTKAKPAQSEDAAMQEKDGKC